MHFKETIKKQKGFPLCGGLGPTFLGLESVSIPHQPPLLLKLHSNGEVGATPALAPNMGPMGLQKC